MLGREEHGLWWNEPDAVCQSINADRHVRKSQECSLGLEQPSGATEAGRERGGQAALCLVVYLSFSALSGASDGIAEIHMCVSQAILENTEYLTTCRAMAILHNRYKTFEPL